jgi:hypothetical protein
MRTARGIDAQHGRNKSTRAATRFARTVRVLRPARSGDNGEHVAVQQEQPKL